MQSLLELEQIKSLNSRVRALYKSLTSIDNTPNVLQNWAVDFFIRKFGFVSYLFIAPVPPEVYSVRRRKKRQNPTVKLKYNKLSMEKNHNMERELKNIVLIFIYMYYLKPSENMFEVK